jgi:hypothetical protein
VTADKRGPRLPFLLFIAFAKVIHTLLERSLPAHYRKQVRGEGEPDHGVGDSQETEVVHLCRRFQRHHFALESRESHSHYEE